MKAAVILPSFKIAENLRLLIVSFIKSQIYAEKISSISLKILTGVSLIYVAFLAFNLLLSTKTSLTFTPQNKKPGPFLTFLMAMILRRILYLSIALKLGWKIFSTRGLESLISGILRFFRTLENRDLEVLHCLYPHFLFCYSVLVLFSHLILIWQKVMAWRCSKIWLMLQNLVVISYVLVIQSEIVLLLLAFRFYLL